MVERSHRISLRSVFLTLLVVALLHIAGMVAYAVRVRASARTLIQSATSILTVADAERLEATWSQSSFQSHTAFHSREGVHGWQFEVRSGLLTTFHLVPSTGLLLQVSTSSGKRQSVVLGMYTEQSSVWVQDDSTAVASSVESQRDPSGIRMKTGVILGPQTDEATRAKAFALNANCLVMPGGCKSAQEMLSTVQQLESTIQPPVATVR